MKDLIDKLRRDVRRLRDEVGPFCSDDGINTLMDIHDELLRTARKLEAALRPPDGEQRSPTVVGGSDKRPSRASS